MIYEDNTTWMLEQLELLCLKLGVKVRFEKLGSKDDELPLKSGMCKFHGQKLIIVDTHLSSKEQCNVLVSALKSFDLSTVFVTPAVRQVVDRL